MKQTIGKIGMILMTLLLIIQISMMLLEFHKNNIEKKEEIERLKGANLDHICTVKGNACLVDEVKRTAHKTNIETGFKYSTLLLFPIIGFSLFYSLMKNKKI